MTVSKTEIDEMWSLVDLLTAHEILDLKEEANIKAMSKAPK